MRLANAVVLSLFAFLFVAPGTAQDIFKRPGHRGPLEKPPSDVKVEGRSRAEGWDHLRCDVPRLVTGLADQQPEDCKRVDFVHLYQKALQIATDEASAMSCDLECSPIYTFEVSRETNCTPSMAYAQVTVAALCTAGDKPPQMARPTAAQLDEPMKVERTKYSGRGEVSVTRELEERPTCPGTSYVHWSHEEAGSCSDYSDAVRRAEAESHTFYDSITCGPNCRKTSEWKDSMVYTSWTCELRLMGGNSVVVDIYLKVVCEPK